MATTSQADALANRDALKLLILALLVGVSYFPALQGGFVWDDTAFAEEPVIHRWSGLWNIWFSPSSISNEGHYWPVVYTSFWLEHKLWGLAPMGYHLVNLLLHWVNCVLVWRLLSRLEVPGAWAVAAVFAVHPLHVESVAWIIERKDLLSALFYLTAAMTWMRFVEAPGWRRYAASLALFTAALLSKSMAVTLPAVLLVWHWWQRDRVTSTDLLRLTPFFAVGLAVTAADYSYYASREVLALGYSAVERLLIASRALWFYVGKLLWPADLAVVYPLWDVRAGDPLAWAYVAGALAVAGLLWFGRERIGRGPLAGALFYLLTLSPVLGFVDYGYMQFAFVADRFQYLPGIAVMAILVGGAAWGASRLPDAARLAAKGLLAVALAVLGALTWMQAGIYRDEVTFFSHVVSHNPKARDAYLNLGKALFDADRVEEGLAASRRAVELRPESAKALSNVGRALLKLEEFEEAERHLRQALEIDPRNASARQNLAEVLRKQKRYGEAVKAFRAVLRKEPGNHLAYAGMGATLFAMERYDEAVAAVRRSLSLKPDNDMAPSLLHVVAEALRKQGRVKEAMESYREALDVDPEFAPAHAGLGIALFQSERHAEAVKAMARALRLQPDLSVAGALHVYMGRAHQSLGEPEAAMERYERALESDPRNTEARDRLAMVLFMQKRYDAALEHYRKLLAADPSGAQTHANLGATLYYLGRPAEALRSFQRALSLDPGLETARTGAKHMREVLERAKP